MFWHRGQSNATNATSVNGTVGVWELFVAIWLTVLGRHLLKLPTTIDEYGSLTAEPSA